MEYEAGRPGWLDSMNGLPGMVGSGMPETHEPIFVEVCEESRTYDRPIDRELRRCSDR
jgi:hypothetical protein